MTSSTHRKRRLAARTRAALLAALGSAGLVAVFAVVLLVVTLAWFGDALLLLVPEQFRVLVALVAFPLLAGALLVVSRWMPAPAFRFRQDGELQQRSAVILFLSPPGSAPAFPQAEQLLAGNLFADGDLLSEHAVRERFGRSPWHMCAEGLAVHGERLEHVVAVCSADSVGADGQPQKDGSHNYRELFTATFEGLFPPDRCPKISVMPARGVDFESARELGLVLEQVVHELKEAGVPEREMIVDVTGGSKVWSAVAGIVALGESRSFQYVSQKDYTVHAYNITPEH